jgi:hypothetical protein
MRGNHVYYLSGVKTLYLTVVSTAQNKSESLGLISLDFTIRENVESAGL